MAEAEVNARIVYWGIDGAGTTANLKAIHAKLRPDHRGPLEEIPTRLDPSVCYERLLIELGQIAGQRTRIQITTVPGAPDHAATRKQLIDRIDGVVLVLDARPECIDANLACFEELRRALSAYGRRLDNLPLVVQYNKRDLSDPFVLEELHRKLELPHAAVFEAIATEGTGVLQTLTTISKRVVRALRDPERQTGHAEPPAPTPEAIVAPAVPAPSATDPVASAPVGFDPPMEAPSALHPPVEEAIAVEAQAHPIGDEPVLEIDPPMASEDVGLPDSEQVAARAQSMLDASWDEIADAEAIADDDETWCLTSLGEAELTGPRSLSLPVHAVDGGGREFRFRLNLSLESMDEDPDTGILS